MRTIPPGESLVYRFTATRAGIWMYHCSTMPMSAHIANGHVRRGGHRPARTCRRSTAATCWSSPSSTSAPRAAPVDVDKLLAEQPDAVVFNGYANQYDHRPLPARRRRAGPDLGARRRPEPGHVLPRRRRPVRHGLRRGRLPAAAAATGRRAGARASPRRRAASSSSTFPEPGHYPFVVHVMVDAERGAHGVFEVR